MPLHTKNPRRKRLEWGKIRVNELRDPNRQLSPSYKGKCNILVWKEWHTRMAMYLAKGMDLKETAAVVGKAIPTVREISRADKMVEKVAEFEARIDDALIEEVVDKMIDVIEMLRAEEQRAGEELIATIENPETPKATLLKAIELLYKLTGRLDKKGEAPQTTIVLGADLINKYQKLREQDDEPTGRNEEVPEMQTSLAPNRIS